MPWVITFRLQTLEVITRQGIVPDSICVTDRIELEYNLFFPPLRGGCSVALALSLSLSVSLSLVRNQCVCVRRLSVCNQCVFPQDIPTISHA
jgi:hypothetical protein